MEDVNTRLQISFLSLNVGAVTKKSVPGKFTFIWDLSQVRIIATKFEKKQSLLNSEVFAVMAIVVAISFLILCTAGRRWLDSLPRSSR